jgi:hypothetical protein
MLSCRVNKPVKSDGRAAPENQVADGSESKSWMQAKAHPGTRAPRSPRARAILILPAVLPVSFEIISINSLRMCVND